MTCEWYENGNLKMKTMKNTMDFWSNGEMLVESRGYYNGMMDLR